MKALKLINIINELSYRVENIPKLFRVVLTLEDAVKDLKKQELNGVTGISDTKEIVMSFLGVARDTVLIMPAKETEKMNKLSRIMYDNPHYLLQDNMYALMRIWDRTPRSMDGVIFNIFEYVVAYWKESHNHEELVYPAQYFAWWQALANVYYEKAKKINNIDDLTKWAIKTTKNELVKEYRHYAEEIAKLSYKEMRDSIWNGLLRVKKIYGSEGEWVIKDKILKIPNGSTLLVLKYPASTWKYSIMDFMTNLRAGKLKEFSKDLPDDEINDAYSDYIWKHSPQLKLVKDNKLDKLYKVIFLNAQEFDGIKKRFFSKKYS